MKYCSIDGCDNEAGLKGTARGLCRSHYKRLCRYGDAEQPLKRTPTWKNHRCSKCSRQAKIQGLCEMHYMRLARIENPEPYLTASKRYAEKQRIKKIILAGRSPTENCELCEEPAKTVWDHDHDLGHFRGWLCDRCNRVLGSVKDDISLLEKMINYLERTKYAVISNNDGAGCSTGR